MQINLEKIGMAPKIAAGLVELNANMHTGELFQHYYLNRPKVMGKVKMTDFAEEFAIAFKQ
jgi:c-di-GMP-related signal transduction protein